MDLDRYLRASALAWGIWTPRAATAWAFLWWFTGRLAFVLALGFVVVGGVRLLIDRPLMRGMALPEQPQARAEALVEAGRD
jgi:hypothetical protein